MREQADVVIIGGGVIGTSIAYHLAKRSCHKLVLLEKDTLGAGSTGRCAGGIRQQFSSQINVRMSLESVKFFESFHDETGLDPDFRRYGYIFLCQTQEQMQAFQRTVAMQRRLGVDVHALSRDELRELVPQLNTADLVGGTYCPSDGYASPHEVTQAFAAQARRLGARIYQETEALAIDVKGGRMKSVITNKGAVDTEVVVNAAGPYAAKVGQMVGIELPVRPSRRHIFVTGPFNGMSARLPLVIDFTTGFYFRREGPSILMGMRNPDEPAGFDTSVDWAFLPRVCEQAARRVPVLEGATIMRGWAGLHEDTPDLHCILGAVPQVQGFICAVGFSGHGFMHSPAVGKLVAELIIDGRTSTIDISPLTIERFSTGSIIAEHNFV